jgi:hypothetical protein
MGESSVLRLRSTDLTWRELDGEIVALDGGQSIYVGTNRVGTLLWHRLAGGTTRDDLTELLCAEFDMDRDVAGADVDRFLDQLRAQGLLEA